LERLRTRKVGEEQRDDEPWGGLSKVPGHWTLGRKVGNKGMRSRDKAGARRGKVVN